MSFGKGALRLMVVSRFIDRGRKGGAVCNCLVAQRPYSLCTRVQPMAGLRLPVLCVACRLSFCSGLL